MSYTPENQNISDPLNKIIEGIRELSNATDERLLVPWDWDETHLTKLSTMLIHSSHNL